MAGPRDDHTTEISQTKISIIWYRLKVESKKLIQMNLYTKQKYIHRHRKRRVTKGKGEEG